MRPRFINTWHNIHTSFWFVPALMAAGAAGLAFGAVGLDRVFGDRLRAETWLWGGSANGARDVLSTIASSMITVAGVTFSVTVVALTMAASQFGPRVLRNFVRDTGNQIVLGSFVSTFLYCLLVLRTIRSGEELVFVPHLAATLALLMAVLAVGVLIYFIHHVATSLQVESLVASIAAELATTIDNLFPEKLGGSLVEQEQEAPHWQQALERPAWDVPMTRSGYVQAIDNDDLLEISERHNLVLRLLCRPGSFASEHMPVLQVQPLETQSDELKDKLARMISVGPHRTITQDVEYPAQQIVSIALRALSPSINDPLTAMICIDWMGSSLLRLAGRKIPSVYRTDGRGRLRVVATTTTFAELADLMFNPIRRAAREQLAVLLRMLEGLLALALGVVRDDDRRAVGEHAERIRAEAHKAGYDSWELQRIDRAYGRVKETLKGCGDGQLEENGRKSGSDSI